MRLSLRWRSLRLHGLLEQHDDVALADASSLQAAIPADDLIATQQDLLTCRHAGDALRGLLQACKRVVIINLQVFLRSPSQRACNVWHVAAELRQCLQSADTHCSALRRPLH